MSVASLSNQQRSLLISRIKSSKSGWIRGFCGRPADELSFTSGDIVPRIPEHSLGDPVGLATWEDGFGVDVNGG